MNLDAYTRMPESAGAVDLRWCQERVARLNDFERDPQVLVEALDIDGLQAMLLAVLKAARLDEHGLSREERNTLRMNAIAAVIEQFSEAEARRSADAEVQL